MTAIQYVQINEVRDHIKAIRGILDDIMFDRYEPVTDAECARLRECYDLICKANDAL